MDNSADDAPRLVAAPRHLRRRVLHEEIPDELLVPGVEPFPLGATRGRSAKEPSGIVSGRLKTYGRKRAVALVAVIIVSLSIPALLFALILAG